MFGHKFDPTPAAKLLGSLTRDGAGHLSHMFNPPEPPAFSRVDRPGALVLGGDHGSLGVARSLGRHGVPVWFITDDKIIAKFSRYVAKSLSWAGPTDGDALDFLLALAKQHHLEGWVLFPAGDREVKLIAQNHAALSRVYRLCTPPWEVTRLAADKHAMYEHAAALGLAYPKCFYPRNRQEVADLQCQFPLILKPSSKESINVLTQAKAWRIADRADLLAKYDAAVKLIGADHIVLQELVPGGGATQFSYTGVWQQGSEVASMIARRTRQFPVEFGTGTYVESIDQPEIGRAAAVFLKSLDYSGMVEIEFKLDTRDGSYKILDVNPRVWTWNALGELAGVDFAYVQWQLAMGESVPVQRARAGAAWMYLSKDIMAACQEMLAGTLSLRDYLKSFRHAPGFAAFAGDDPLPAFVDLPLGIWRFFKQRLARSWSWSPTQR